MNKVVVIAVHPDDETLGCGGTLLRHKAQGDEINWLIATDMQEKHGFKKKDIKIREREINSVAKAYGFENVHTLGIPTIKVDTLAQDTIVKKISKVFNEIKPRVVYLPFYGDPHSDHRQIFEATFSCLKTFRSPFVKKVLMMETISETEFAPSFEETTFRPNYFKDISETINKKISIFHIYKSEIKQHPFPRNAKNIKALATFRGAMAGCKYAESFMLLKEIA